MIELVDAMLLALTLAAFVAVLISIWWQRTRTRYEATRPDAYAIMEQSLASQQRRMDELEARRMSDHALIIDLRNEVAALRVGIAVLIRQVQEAGLTPQWQPVATGTTSTPVDKRALAQRIAVQFDLDEMATLMFDINIDDEELAGRTRQARARELVDYAERHGQLDILAAAVAAQRPEKS